MGIDSHLSTCVGTQSPKYLEMAQGHISLSSIGLTSVWQSLYGWDWCLWWWHWGCFDARRETFGISKQGFGSENKHLFIYEKEFLALILAVDRWRAYLQRSPFKIRTGQESLSFLDEQQLQSDLQIKAMAKLMGLQFKFVYKKGKENVVADALSRVGDVMSLCVLSEVQPVWVQEVLNSYVLDAKAQELLHKLVVHSPDEEGFSVQQGLIRKQHQVWIWDNSALKTKIMATMHDSVVGGHSGASATYHWLKRVFYWSGMKTDVVEFVK
jgi:hypothetical protein